MDSDSQLSFEGIFQGGNIPGVFGMSWRKCPVGSLFGGFSLGRLIFHGGKCPEEFSRVQCS